MPGVSTRWMTVITFALGVAACTANQRQLGEVYGATREGPRPSGLYIALATALGIVMLAAGILAFVLASEAMLATLVAAMVALWLVATGEARADRPSATACPPCRALRTARRRADPVRRPQGRAVGFGQWAGRPGDGGCSDPVPLEYSIEWLTCAVASMTGRGDGWLAGCCSRSSTC